MLDHIRVSGFQSLRDVDIDLGRFTVIVGESGCGKSAFIRSLLKMSRNDAVSGTSGGADWSHLPPAASNAVVTLDIDGHTVQWIKGKDNCYVVDGEKLSKVGKGCPDEVQDILKMRELAFDGTDKYHLNFAQQFDMPFLLDDSGSKVAKILGEITNVNILYAANRQANTLKGNATRTLTVRKDDLTNQTELLQEFVGLPAKKRALTAIQELQTYLLAEVDLYKELFSFNTRLCRLQEQGSAITQRLEALRELPAASERVLGAQEGLYTLKQLTDLRASLGKCREEGQRLGDKAKLLNPVRKVDAGKLDKALSVYEKMQGALVDLVYREGLIVELEEDLEEFKAVSVVDTEVLIKDLSNYDALRQVLVTLDNQMGYTNAAKFNFGESKKALKVAQKSYDDFVAEYPQCPFCGAPLGTKREEVAS